MKSDEQILLASINEVVGCNLKELKDIDVGFDKNNVDELLRICQMYYAKLSKSVDEEKPERKYIGCRLKEYCRSQNSDRTICIARDDSCEYSVKL